MKIPAGIGQEADQPVRKPMSHHPRPAGANRFRRIPIACCLWILAAAVGSGHSIAVADVARPPLTIADFDFIDTSGEVRDQTREHQARLTAFGETLRKGFDASENVALVELPCGSGGCSARKAGLEALIGDAQRVGARYLVIGEVHKMSTLVGWVKYAMLDLRDGKATCDRFLTYRGDTDEAWERAARFTARDVQKHCFPTP